MGRYLYLIFTLFGGLLLQAHEVEQHFMRFTLADDHHTAPLEMDAGYALPEDGTPPADPPSKEGN